VAKRYSKATLDKMGVRLVPEAKGSKGAMHAWQNKQIVDFVKTFGRRPKYNYNNY